MNKDDLERYDVLENNLMSSGTRYKYNYAKNSLKSGKILDIGCGLVNAAEYFNDVVAVDNDLENVKIIKERYPKLKVIHADALNLPFENEYFDGCLLIEVIEHVNDVPKLLKEISRILKPKGRCIITTPNREVTEIFVKLKLLKPKICSHHFKEYTITELKDIFKKNDLKIVKISGITQIRYSISNWFIFRNKLVSKILLNTGRFFPFLASNIILICEK